MRSLTILVAALAAASAAHADTWSFSYVGATSADAPFTLPSIDGSFTAADLDGNGLISRNEVQTLNFFNYQMAPSVDMGIPGQPPGSLMSELTTFNFDTATQALAFTGHAGSWDDAYVKTDTTLEYTTGIGLFNFDLTTARLDVQHVDNGISTLQAETLPVPEPGTWALMGCGLALLAWRQSRAARARSPLPHA